VGGFYSIVMFFMPYLSITLINSFLAKADAGDCVVGFGDAEGSERSAREVVEIYMHQFTPLSLYFTKIN